MHLHVHVSLWQSRCTYIYMSAQEMYKHLHVYISPWQCTCTNMYMSAQEMYMHLHVHLCPGNVRAPTFTCKPQALDYNIMCPIVKQLLKHST